MSHTDELPEARRSIRMKDFDYTSDARWFVTICTHERECTLGKIIDGEMHLNECGEIASECWHAIPDHFSNVTLDEHVIMPNHIHGTLEIFNEINPNPCIGKASPCRLEIFDETNHNFCSGKAPPCRRKNEKGEPEDKSKIARFGKPIAGSLGIIIGSFKSIVTKRVNELRGTPGKPFWQRNYWEHGIRTDKELDRIREYIKMNPMMWEEDEDNPKHMNKGK